MTFLRRTTAFRALFTKRHYASVSPFIIILPSPPPPPKNSVSQNGSDKTIGESLFDTKCFAALSDQTNQTPLTTLIHQYVQSAGTVLDRVHLPYESRPEKDERVNVENSKDVVLVAHCATDGFHDKVTLSSGFLLNAQQQKNDESLVLTCAHTLEEIRNSPLLQQYNDVAAHNWQSGTFVVTTNSHDLHPAFHPVSRVVSSLPLSDMVLLSCKLPEGAARALPVSPYPVPSETKVKAHFVVHQKPEEPGWCPWLGGTWSKWVSGEVMGYRDLAGKETQPGTYDALSHMVFKPQPTAGSSGGPIVDEESGAVVGVMLGTRMDSAAVGMQGWGVPAEAIYEMFALPGLPG